MGIEIIDGRGSGLTAGVTDENELLTHARIESHLTHASQDQGRAFWVSSDFVALTTTGSFNGILYLKNTSEDRRVYLFRIRMSASVAQQWKLIKNPTGGTLLTDAVAAYTENLNFRSSLTLVGNAFRASGNGKTVTGGSHVTQWASGSAVITHDLEGAVILGTNDSVALVCKPAVAGDAGASFLITQQVPPE